MTIKVVMSSGHHDVKSIIITVTISANRRLLLSISKASQMDFCNLVKSSVYRSHASLVN